MHSPAKRHYMKAMAAKESEQAAESDIRPDANQYELMQAQLFEHTRQLKNVQSVKAKADLKADLLPLYAPYIEGVLEADTGVADDVLMTVLVWRIDAGDWDGALDIAAYALRHGLDLPDRYQRTTATTVTEELAEAALKGAEIPADTLNRFNLLLQPHDMPDQVRAKLLKAMGLALVETAPKEALNLLEKALSYHDKAGVKKDIEKLQRTVKNMVPDPADQEA